MNERDKLQTLVDDHAKSQTKLQHVLQQMSRDRENDIMSAQQELARKLAHAEALQQEKDSEMSHLRNKLAEAQLGLEAAARLTQKLDKTAANLAASKQEGTRTVLSDAHFSCLPVPLL